MKKYNLYLHLILISIFISLFVVLLNVKILILNENFYHNEFKKYGVYENLKDYDIDKINKETVDFVLGKKNSLPANFFSYREIKHLNDVKKLMEKLQILFLFSMITILLYLIFLLFYLKKMKKVLQYISLSCIIASVIVILFSFFLLLSIKLDFNLSFDLFHTAFFEKKSYTFNPTIEKIVVLYPEGLFYDAAKSVLINSVIASLVVLILSLFFIGSIGFIYNKIKRLI